MESTAFAARRLVPMIGALVALVALLAAAPVSAAVSCSYSGATKTVTVTMSAPDDGTTVTRSGTPIFVAGVACGAATVNNTDLIRVNGSAGNQSLIVSLAGGLLAPGFTAEPTGLSEIELEYQAGNGTDSFTLNGRPGADKFRLGTGGVNANNDSDADYTLADNEGVTMSAGAGGTDEISAAGGNGTGAVFPEPVVLHGGNGFDTLTGGAENDTLYGNGSADELRGGAGEDNLYGHDGNDTLRGQDGSDNLVPGAGDDFAYGNAGNDSVQTENAPDGADLVDGGDGNRDRVSYSSRAAGVSVTRDGTADDGDIATDEHDNVLPSVEAVDGGSGPDVLGPGPGPDELRGNDGNDQLTGGGGNDSLTGGNGDDTLTDSAGADSLQGGDGADVLNSGDDNDFLSPGIGGDTANAGDGFDTIYSSPGADTLRGGPGPDNFYAEPTKDGNDKVYGDAGQDWFSYSSRTAGVTVTLGDDLANDGQTGSTEKDNLRTIEHITGTHAPDVIAGSREPNQIYGYGGNDKLSGGPGTDSLFGYDGNDTLKGGDGTDNAYGEEGDDVFSMVDGGRDYSFGGPGTDSGSFDPVFDYTDSVP